MYPYVYVYKLKVSDPFESCHFLMTSQTHIDVKIKALYKINKYEWVTQFYSECDVRSLSWVVNVMVG